MSKRPGSIWNTPRSARRWTARPAPSWSSRATWYRVNGITAPLVTITQIQPIKVSFSLPQSDLPRIQAQAKHGGLTATVDLHDAGRRGL